LPMLNRLVLAVAETSPPSNAESARSGNATPAPSAPPAASRSNPSQNATVAEGTTADRQTTTESPSADTSSTEARPEQPSSLSASDAPPPSPPESASPPAPSPSSPESSTPEVSTQAQRSPTPQDSPESPEQVSVDGSVERAAAEQPIPSAEREPENVFAPPPSAGAPTAQTGGASRGRSPNSAPARETAREAPREAVVLPGTEDITAASEDADTTADFPAAERSQVIEQVRTYFDQRWQADETDSLRYQLALSETGEVLRFEGMDEASRREGDRILPSNPPPSLPVGTLPRPITLRVLLLPNGDVQVLEL
ncbi:MAG: hypothetical protein AAGM45_09655, partial [Cyanobacteria bacterium J06588_5]